MSELFDELGVAGSTAIFLNKLYGFTDILRLSTNLSYSR